jgi:hypothetical protein
MSIFVFGSNEAGIHGAGAAYFASRHHGAISGIGLGPQGQSFAIPTKDWHISTLPIEAVEHYVRRFLAFARIESGETFHVSQIGCGLAGFTADQIAPLFRDAPPNCLFSSQWAPWLPGREWWTDL